MHSQGDGGGEARVFRTWGGGWEDSRSNVSTLTYTPQEVVGSPGASLWGEGVQPKGPSREEAGQISSLGQCRREESGKGSHQSETGRSPDPQAPGCSQEDSMSPTEGDSKDTITLHHNCKVMECLPGPRGGTGPLCPKASIFPVLCLATSSHFTLPLPSIFMAKILHSTRHF